MSENNDAVKFAYWVPNVSGGLVVSKIEQRTDWGYEYNRSWAGSPSTTASSTRFAGPLHGELRRRIPARVDQLQPRDALATEKLKVIAAVHPGLWHPAVLAKFVASADQMSGGRFAVNVVSGWFKGEFTALGEPWLEHDERYRRCEEFIRVLEPAGPRTTPSSCGDFYRLHGFDLKPEAARDRGPAAPGDLPGRQLDRRPRHGRPGQRLVLHQRQQPRRRRGADRGGQRVRPGRRPRTAPLRPQRLHRRPRHRGGGARTCRGDHRQGRRRGGRGLRRRGQAGRPVDRRQAGHVAGLGVRRPGPVQRRLPHRPDRHPRADRPPDRRSTASTAST